MGGLVYVRQKFSFFNNSGEMAIRNCFVITLHSSVQFSNCAECRKYTDTHIMISLLQIEMYWFL